MMHGDMCGENQAVQYTSTNTSRQHGGGGLMVLAPQRILESNLSN